MKVALFAPCYVDYLYPQVAIAALHVLERLGISVGVPDGAACCGQPPANAGFAEDANRALDRFVQTFAPYDRIVVISGSCALHVRNHAASLGEVGARVASRTLELCSFLYDEIGVDRVAALEATLHRRVAVHIGCHALRGLGLARPSELQESPFDKVRALLGTVQGLSFASLTRVDECCGFGGTFATTEPMISVGMGRSRLHEYAMAQAETVVSTDVSCLMHLEGVARNDGSSLPMVHVAQVLAGECT
jgi:L-lactate dehydrogenase complex protein LldE